MKLFYSFSLLLFISLQTKAENFNPLSLISPAQLDFLYAIQMLPSDIACQQLGPFLYEIGPAKTAILYLQRYINCPHDSDVTLFVISNELGHYNPPLSFYHALRCKYMRPKDRKEVSPYFAKFETCINNIKKLREWAKLGPFTTKEESELYEEIKPLSQQSGSYSMMTYNNGRTQFDIKKTQEILIVGFGCGRSRFNCRRREF